jgi:hypothetical protein
MLGQCLAPSLSFVSFSFSFFFPPRFLLPRSKRFEEGRKLLNEASFGLKYIEENASSVFKSEDFNDLSRESLAILLKSNNLAIEEVEVIAAVLRWAEAECKRQSKKATADNKKEVIGDLIYQIRFTEMTMSDIVSTVQPSGILPQEDLLALFTYIGASKDNKPSTKFNTKPREGAGAFLKSVILKPEHHKILQNYYDKSKPSKWKRIFHGLEDGMNASSFHAKCDNVTPTIVVCKSTNGNIFGGYTQYSWSSGSYKTDSSSFLFSLVNSHKKPFKQVSTSDSYSIYAYSSYGYVGRLLHRFFSCFVLFGLAVFLFCSNVSVLSSLKLAQLGEAAISKLSLCCFIVFLSFHSLPASFQLVHPLRLPRHLQLLQRFLLFLPYGRHLQWYHCLQRYLCWVLQLLLDRFVLVVTALFLV